MEQKNSSIEDESRQDARRQSQFIDSANCQDKDKNESRQLDDVWYKECLKKRDEYLEGWQRARAELANFKKAEVERFTEIIRTANQKIILDLIIVLDSFDLGLAVLEKDGKAEKGMYLIRSQIEDILKSYGLERMIVSVGQKFDPNIHDAVAEVKSDLEEGVIVEEVERGYLLHGKVLRPARVKIAKAK